jgi:hypothetical protein
MIDSEESEKKIKTETAHFWEVLTKQKNPWSYAPLLI